MKIEREVFVSALKVVAALKTDIAAGYAVFLFGNGGSAALANHFECDLTKGTSGKLIARSLCANPSMLTAIGNDMGYQETLAAQLSWSAGKNTCILISSSGDSPNIISGVKMAKKNGRRVIGFTGFNGGYLKKYADVSVHIDSNDYGVVEDFHSNVLHEIVRQIKELPCARLS